MKYSDPPASVRSMEQRIRNLEGNEELAVRRRVGMALVVVGQMLPEGAIKGGSAMALRYGRGARFTQDLDVARVQSLAKFCSDFEDSLAVGWAGFTGRLIERQAPRPTGVPTTYVMKPFDVKLDYQGRPWCTVRFELGHNEIGDADEPEHQLADSLSELFTMIGLEAPKPVPVMRADHQVAQKLHALSAVGSDRARDLVDLQLLDRGEPVDLLQVKATCERLFEYRRQHAWPPTVAAGTGWAAAYRAAAEGLGVIDGVDDAVDWVNSFIRRIADARWLGDDLAGALRGGPPVWAFAPGVAVPRGGELPAGTALVIGTSGSTDTPKRVVHTRVSLEASATMVRDALGGDGTWLLALPTHYIAGAQVLVRSALAGTEPEIIDPGFTPGEFVAATNRLATRTAGPRFVSLVPPQLALLVDASGSTPAVARALATYDAILLGGQAAPAPLVEAAERLGARVIRTYGAAETGGGCVYDGRPLAGVRVRAVDGVLEVSGPMLAAGYLAAPAPAPAPRSEASAADGTPATFPNHSTATAFTTDPDGSRWYRTNDLVDTALLASSGTVRILGRADDVINSGGVKVVLGEIERAVRATAPDAIAVRVHDARWGERAVIITTVEVELRALIELVDAAGLHPAARPVRVTRVSAIPMLSTGKPDRLAAQRLVE